MLLIFCFGCRMEMASRLFDGHDLAAVLTPLVVRHNYTCMPLAVVVSFFDVRALLAIHHVMTVQSLFLGGLHHERIPPLLPALNDASFPWKCKTGAVASIVFTRNVCSRSAFERELTASTFLYDQLSVPSSRPSTPQPLSMFLPNFPLIQ